MSTLAQKILDGEYEVLAEATQDANAKRQLASKIRSLNSTLESLLQKKIRIDLEIRSVRKKLTKLKKSSNLEIKTHVSLESSLSPEIQGLRDYLLDTTSNELEQELQRADYLLESYADLPLYQ